MTPGRRFGGGRLVKRNGAYVGVWTGPDGRRHRRILSTDKRLAERALALAIRDRDCEVLGLKHEEGMECRLSEIRERYLADLASYAKPAHAKRIAHVTAKMIEAVGDVAVRDLRLDALLAFRQRRVKQGAANRTVNLEVGAFKSMVKWATDVGLIPRNPIANLKPLPSGKAYEKCPRRALSREEIDALLAAAVRIDERLRARHAAERSISVWGRGAAHRDRPRKPYVPQAPLWRAFLWTGGRWTELTSTVWADFSEGERTLRLRVQTTKGKRQRIIPLLDSVVQDLVALREVHRNLLGREPGPAEHIFLGPRGKPVVNSYRRALYRFCQLGREAGIPDVDELGLHTCIHGLRHTFISELGRAGVGLLQAQRLAGHSDPWLTSQIYSHLGVEDLRGAVDKLQPRTSKPTADAG
jgi:integrase